MNACMVDFDHANSASRADLQAYSVSYFHIAASHNAMPEGPEIYRAARALNDALANQPLTIQFLHPALKPKARALKGERIVRVHARSKAMLTEFSSGHVLYSHNQLYGEWHIHTRDEALFNRQARLIFSTREHRAVLYSATEFAWLFAGEEARHPYIAKLGPEVLADDIAAKIIAARLRTFPRRVIADALLDQSVVAGLGNYLRADILFVAKVNPFTRIGDLTPAALARIARACKTLTARSVKHAGVVRPMADYTNALKAEVIACTEPHAAHERARFFVFDREGEACWDCGDAITRVDRGGRGVFFCAACQGVGTA
jgi:endonuclease VIII